MNKMLNRLMLGGSVIALSAASAGVSYAQGTSNDIETVTVSASRISIAGYTAPTPVTVVGAAQLLAEAKSDVGDAIREMPAVQGASPQAGSSAVTISGAPGGQSNVFLRNLGLLRTLVLVDGQRVVQSNVTGGVDLNTIPTAIVERVDIVTGGASAAWGSDAVAGVINLILNKNFTGFKANAEFSDNGSDTYRSTKLEASWGGDVLGGRGHLIFSGAMEYSPDWDYDYQNGWYDKTQIVNNPAYNATTNPNVPQQIHASNIGQSTATLGGLIVSSPAVSAANSPTHVAIPANVLRGIDFVGPNAQATQINIGNVVGPAAWGGDLGFYDSQTPIDAIALPHREFTAYAYGAYKLSDTIRASVQLNYGHDYEQDEGVAASLLGTFVVQSDNAYIPASVKATMTADGITSFNLGTLNINNIDLHHYTAQSEEQDGLGVPINNNDRQQLRGVFTVDGTLGNDWGWTVFAQHGQTKIGLRVFANSLVARLPLAADAVTVTTTNVGTSGLLVGSIACRSTLSSPSNGCKPLDVFGTGVASTQAINYINPSNLTSGQDREDITMGESDFSGSLQGTLPWGMPAGPIAVATGAEYRLEQGRIIADPRGATAQWGSGNFANLAGGYSVEEGFLEVDAPVLKNDIVQSFNVNAAGRITNYSTSGLVETWKVGAVSQISDDIRLRAVWSTDIRAPNIAELFTAHQINTGAAIDLNSPSCTSTTLNKFGFPNSVAGCASPFVATDRSGNTALTPEVGRTITAGVVLTPSFLEGFQFGLDWYNISIADAITTLVANPTNCANALSQLYCTLQLFNGPLYANGKPQLTTLSGYPVNANSERTSGVDIQSDYAFDFLGGTLTWAFKATYVDEYTIVNIGVTCDQMGTQGLGGCGGNTLPKFKGTLAATYAEGPYSFTVQSRFQGSMTLNNTWTSGVQIDRNEIDPNAYLDLRASYKWNDIVQFYGAIDNLQDIPPILTPPLASTGSSYQSLGFSGDNLGRVMRIGVRVSE